MAKELDLLQTEFKKPIAASGKRKSTPRKVYDATPSPLRGKRTPKSGQKKTKTPKKSPSRSEGWVY